MMVGSWLYVEHVLHPVRAIRNLRRDPYRMILLPPAKPIWPEAEDVFVKTIHHRAVFDDEADVDHAMGNCAFLAIGLSGLEEGNAVSFGIGEFKFPAAVRVLFDSIRNFDSLHSQILSQTFGIRCAERHHFHAVRLAAVCLDYLYKLIFANLILTAVSAAVCARYFG